MSTSEGVFSKRVRDMKTMLQKAAAVFCCLCFIGLCSCRNTKDTGIQVSSDTLSDLASMEMSSASAVSSSFPASSQAASSVAGSAAAAGSEAGSSSRAEASSSKEISSHILSSSEAQQVVSEPQTDGWTSIEDIMQDMSLHDKICQMLILSPEQLTGSARVTAADETMKQALQKLPAGGILYNTANFINKQQVREMLSETQRCSRIPLILTCDEEGGRVNRLMQTVGTTNIGPMFGFKDMGTETAYQNAHTIAADMHALGFNTDLAPVADVWSNPDNTVIGDRAYSDSFSQAAELIPAAVRGFHDGGVATALKHFPGHGDTFADSHDGAVTVTKSLEELRKNELLPFQAGIDAGSDMVMIGHLTLTEIDPSQPAPFSARIVTELLREELGFRGVVITDGLQMKALTNDYSSGEIAVRAVSAGVDLLLCPDEPMEAVASLQEAVTSGAISIQRIDESVRRILSMKINRGMIKLCS